jgi:ketosteroid isomerase-like protein
MKRQVAAAVAALLVAGLASAAPAPRSPAQDRAAIERLHQLDVRTTLSDKADELAKLWDADAVRLGGGGPAEVGKAKIYADDKRWEQSSTSHTLTYRADVQDLQLAGDWAFEWGYFETAFKPSPDAAVVTLKGKQLRVLKRQADGSWKFARVMSLVDKQP